MVAEGEVCGIRIKFLNDTGSAITLISRVVFESINNYNMEELYEVPFEVWPANGNKLQVMGGSKMKITLGSKQLMQDVVVADIKAEGILGMDFLGNHQCILNVAKSEMKLDGDNIPLTVEGLPVSRCCRITTMENEVVPPEQEKLIRGKLVPNGPSGSLYITEPAPSLVIKEGILVARTLIDSKNRNVIMRILNPRPQEVTLRKNTTLAVAEPVHNIEQNQNTGATWSVAVVTLGQGRQENLLEHLQDLFDRSSHDLDGEQKQKLKDLLLEFQDVFADGNGRIGRTNLINHRIDTGDAKPIKQRPRPVPIHLRQELDQAMEDLIEKDLIEPSNSPWCAPIVLVRKKDGTLRTCIDYRQLNDISKKDSYPTPSAQSSLDHLSGARYFSTLDLASGYHQIEMEPRDREKTAFCTGRHGLYQYKVMPFGLSNGTATFQRLMEKIFAREQWTEVLLYVDDIISFSKNFPQGIERLRVVFQQLQDAGLTLKAKKCVLFQKQVAFLGHIVSKDGVATDPGKVSTVRDWPTPRSTTEVRSFVGLCAYYRRFIRNFSQVAKPLHRLTEKNVKFSWSDNCQSAFEELKVRLTSAPILTYPNERDEFTLDTDASDKAMGAVLSQVQDGAEKVIAYGSKTFSRSERNYCVTRKELLAVVYFTKYFKQYLLGKHFIIRTDHGSLRWLMNFKDPQGQTARWLEVLSTYDFTIQHRPGNTHRNADVLSRVPCKQCGRSADNVCRIEVAGIKTGNLKDQQQNWVLPWSIEELQEKQQQDPVLSKFITMKALGERPKWEEISLEGQELKHYWCIWDHIEIRQGVLYMLWEDPMGHGQELKLIIPHNLREEVLRHSHDSVVAGHLGQHKTLQRIRARFYWCGYRQYVENWCRKCDTCASRKGMKKPRRAPMQRFLSGCPLERVSLDIMGPLPRSKKGNQYVLVIVDHFTKWTEALPMPNQEAITVARKFFSEFICRFGVPYEILTDQGTQFQSTLFTELAGLLDMDKTRTSAYHPMANGLVERFNRTLEMMLSMFVSDTQRDWDQYIPALMLAYRSTQQETTGVSPYKMMFGREATLPIDLIMGRPPNQEGVTLDSSEYVYHLRDRLEDIFEMARHHLKTGAQRQKRLYDRNTSGKAYQEGELVWVAVTRKKIGISPKLQRRWQGPYKVTRKLGEVLYQLKRPGSKRLIVHFNRLKPYLGTQRLREEGNNNTNNGSCSENDDSDSETTDHHGWGAGHPEVFSSQGDEGLERRNVQPDGDDYQEAQYGGMANPRGGSGMEGVRGDIEPPPPEVGDLAPRSQRMRRPPERLSYF